MNYKSGDVYQGEFYENVRHGNGIMQWKSKNEIYKGEWKVKFH